jgi:voltage-gated potassium channel
MRIPNTPRQAVRQFFEDPASIRAAAWLIVGATAVAVFAGSLVMRVFDHKEYPTFGRALWFTLQTVTTVGYGDVTPTSSLGRAVAAVVMLTAIGFITVVTAAITSTFVEAAQRRRQKSEEAASAAATAHTENELAAITSRLDAISDALDSLSEQVQQLGAAKSAQEQHGS